MSEQRSDGGGGIFCGKEPFGAHAECYARMYLPHLPYTIPEVVRKYDGQIIMLPMGCQNVTAANKAGRGKCWYLHMVPYGILHRRHDIYYYLMSFFYFFQVAT